MEAHYLNQDTVNEIMAGVGHRIFSVTFEKADGSIRKLNGRLGVYRHLKGGESTINHLPYLQGCWDVQKDAYRAFNKSKVLSLKVGGKVYDA